MKPASGKGNAMQWYLPHATPFRLAGFAWFDEDRVYRRLPVLAEGKLPAGVDALANCTAGGQIRFQTDSRRVRVRVSLAGRADMNHMPSTGQCGFDLYIGAPGQMRYCNTTKYDYTRTDYDLELFEHPRRAWRHMTLYWPLYQGVKQVHVGLERDAGVRKPRPFAGKGPVVFYGTSITQGGCASRPGMAYPSIIGRDLNVETVNLGFSGNGRGEPEVAAVVASVPRASLFVIDYEANCVDTETFRRTLPEFVRIVREAHPRTPILVVSRIAFAKDIHFPGWAAWAEERRAIQRGVVAKARRRGDRRVSFFDGRRMLGRDFEECTVDGVHPTDLGFYRMAKGLGPTIGRLVFGLREGGVVA